MEKRTALIVGATGLVGREVLNVVLKYDYYDEIIVLGRSSIAIKDNRIKEVLINFDDLANHKDEISAHDYYVCIGTTMKQAGSKEVFYRVDFTYPHELGKIAEKDPKFEQYLLVSSLGADAESALFYNEVKGQIEEALKVLNLKTLHIFQPSLLIGARKDFRFFEELAKFFSSMLSFFVIGSGKRFWAIEGTSVAKAMFLIAKRKEEGTFTHRPAEMLKIAPPNKS